MKKPVIFVVEDSPFVQDLIEFSLSLELDCEIKKFKGVYTAIESIKIDQPDIVILDYLLNSNRTSAPNGLVFFKSLKRLGLKIPTVVFSGQNDKNVAVSMLKSGAVDYISKNDDSFLKDLIASINRILKFKRLEQEIEEQRIKKIRFFKNATLLLSLVTLTILVFSFLK